MFWLPLTLRSPGEHIGGDCTVSAVVFDFCAAAHGIVRSTRQATQPAGRFTMKSAILKRTGRGGRRSQILQRELR